MRKQDVGTDFVKNTAAIFSLYREVYITTVFAAVVLRNTLRIHEDALRVRTN